MRAVSTLFAANTSAAAKMIVSDMVNTGSQSGEPYRLQVAYKHLETPGILKGVTYDTNAINNSDYVYDVGIILQEISL